MDNTITLSGPTPWSLPSAGFVNPSYLSAPAGFIDQGGTLGSVGFDIACATSVLIAFEGTYSGQTVAHQQTFDPAGLIGWFPVSGVAVGTAGSTPDSTASTAVNCYCFAAIGVRHRIQVTALASGTMQGRVGLTGATTAAVMTGGALGGSGALANQVQGNAGNQTTDLGNPVKVGGRYLSGVPTLSTGQRSDFYTNVNGCLRVSQAGAAVTFSDGGSNNGVQWAQDNAVATSNLAGFAPFIFNGGTWDRRVKANATSRITTSAATTNPTSAKASAGNIFAITALNTTGTITYLKIYNKASAPTVGTDTPVQTYAIPANGQLTLDFANGYYLGTGIAYGLTTDVADGGSTAVAAGAIVGLNIIYS